MKKLLALFIIGGLLSTITGCPPGATTPTTKKEKETPKGGMTTKDMEKDKGKTPSTTDKGKGNEMEKDKGKAPSTTDKDKAPSTSDKEKDKGKK